MNLRLYSVSLFGLEKLVVVKRNMLYKSNDDDVNDVGSKIDLCLLYVVWTTLMGSIDDSVLCRHHFALLLVRTQVWSFYDEAVELCAGMMSKSTRKTQIQKDLFATPPPARRTIVNKFESNRTLCIKA